LEPYWNLPSWDTCDPKALHEQFWSRDHRTEVQDCRYHWLSRASRCCRSESDHVAREGWLYERSGKWRKHHWHGIGSTTNTGHRRRIELDSDSSTGNTTSQRPKHS